MVRGVEGRKDLRVGEKRRVVWRVTWGGISIWRVR